MSNRPVRQLLIAGVAVFAVGGLTVGCSSNSPKSTAGAAGSTSAATTAATGATTAATAAAAGATDTAATPTSGAPSVKAGSGKGTAFCKELEQLDSYSDSIGDDAADTPDQVKKEVQLYEGVKSSLEKSAPAEIKPDLTTLFGFLDQYYDALKKAGYDFTKLDPTAMANLAASGDKLEAAGDHVTQYVDTACGVDLDDDSASPSS